ncbi:MAG: glycosyltransferase family 2 protein [Chitinophagaceae bacterium]|nr:glycosyltransferase family 2 protein [Chitinophagaceae bacterium]
MHTSSSSFITDAKIAVVIPCYNVERHIEAVVKELPEFVSWIIAVNDCSRDGTLNLLYQIAQVESRLQVVNHPVNQGVGGAMISGYQEAINLGAEVVVKMDGDGQMDASNISFLVQPLLEGKSDFSKGNRFRDFKALRSMPIFRRIGNLGLSFMIKAASGYWNIFDPTNGFTAIRGDMLRQLELARLHKRYYFETSMISELYLQHAVIQDIPMKAKYGDEISGLSIWKTLIEFPPKLLYTFLRRILLKYFLYDFNLGSLYLISGAPIFLVGLIYGLVKYKFYLELGVGAPTGTVVIPTLMIIMGFQLLLAGLAFDVEHYPKKSV